MNGSIEFGTLTKSGVVINQRTISKTTIKKCPHVIFVPEHYKEDGSCKCYDKSETVMTEWGYMWNEEKGQWDNE